MKKQTAAEIHMNTKQKHIMSIICKKKKKIVIRNVKNWVDGVKEMPEKRTVCHLLQWNVCCFFVYESNLTRINKTYVLLLSVMKSNMQFFFSFITPIRMQK